MRSLFTPKGHVISQRRGPTVLSRPLKTLKLIALFLLAVCWSGFPAGSAGAAGGPRTDGRLVGTMWVQRSMEVGDEDVFLLGTGGHRTRNLTDAGFRQDDAVWSPDGRSLAFSSPYGLHIMRANGSRERLLVRSHSIGDRHFFPLSPAWSPDGTQLAFSETVYENDAWGASSLVTVSLAGAKKVVADPASPIYTLDWSPDGKEIVFGECSLYDFVAVRDQDCGVEIVRADGTNQRRLSDEVKPFDIYPMWNAAGRVIFVSDRDCPDPTQPACGGVYSMASNGSEIELIERDTDWNGDGRTDSPSRVIPSSASPHEMVVAVWIGPGFDRSEVWAWNSKTGSKRRLFAGNVENDLDWQPLCTVPGTHGDDVLRGTASRDRICGLGGDDTIRGLGGDDVIFGHGGRDVIDGGAGADIVVGNGGRDRCDRDKRDHSRVC